MTERTKSTIVLLLVLLVVGWSVLWATPLGLRKEGAVDITSGDYRYRVYFCGIPVKSRIGESSLSREARRLGIAVPAKRQWRHMWSHYGGVYRDSFYGFAMGQCDELVSLLESTNAPDEERRTVLKSFMASLRTGDSRQAYGKVSSLMHEMGERLNERLKTLRKEQEAQTAVP
jgi:hypothetical protein